jgi:hypothetical protein
MNDMQSHKEYSWAVCSHITNAFDWTMALSPLFESPLTKKYGAPLSTTIGDLMDELHKLKQL